MNKKLQGLNRFWMLAALIGILILVTCSSNGVLEHDDASNDLSAILAVDMVRGYDPDNPGLAKPDGSTYLICYAEAKEDFDQDGGSLEIQLDNEDIFFIIPRGALPDDNNGDGYEIRIWGEKWNTPDGPVFYYECYPEGMVFAEPIVLIQPLSNEDYEVEYLYWYDPAADEWKKVDLEEVVSESADFEIHHFSKYAISD